MFDIDNIVIEDVTPQEVRHWAHNLVNLIDSGVALGGHFFAEDKINEPIRMHHEVSEALLRGRVWYRCGSYEQEITLRLLTSSAPLVC